MTIENRDLKKEIKQNAVKEIAMRVFIKSNEIHGLIEYYYFTLASRAIVILY